MRFFVRALQVVLPLLVSLLAVFSVSGTAADDSVKADTLASIYVESIPKPADLQEIPLYDKDLGVGVDTELWERFFDQVMVRNISAPSLIPVLPERKNRNGKAIIIVPGGGYQFVSIENEGFGVAQQLQDAGYSTFILKYRLPATPMDPRENLAELSKLFSTLGKRNLADHKPAVDDLAQALALVSSRSPEWGINPGKIGVIGFSAGARSIIRLLEAYDEASLAEHLALMYPPMNQTVKSGPRPPLFLAIAADDPLFRQGGMALPEAWYKQSKNMEFHLYSGGNHGFGSRPNGSTSDTWLAGYLAWLNRNRQLQ